uniref:Uncharacterized protein n=1 Tax=Ditylenchus dipsaci TaxID=166011 RepID=A0A915DTS6_9BILA
MRGTRCGVQPMAKRLIQSINFVNWIMTSFNGKYETHAYAHYGVVLTTICSPAAYKQNIRPDVTMSGCKIFQATARNGSHTAEFLQRLISA